MDRTRALWIGFLAVWGFTLLAYGGVSVGASAIAAASMAALNLAAARLLPDPLRLSRAGVLFLAGTAALFLLQLLPVGPLLFPVTHAWRQVHGTGGLWPGTADTFRTLLALTQFALYILSVLLIFRLRQAGLGASTVLRSAVGVLSLEALYGIVQTFADLKDLPFFGPRPCYGSASGTLVGRNNFAGLMAVGFVIATALAWGRFSWPLRRPDDPGRPRWARRLEGASPWACAAALFAVAILLSHSRGGALAAIGGAAILPFVHRGRASVAGAAGLVLVAAGAAAITGLGPLLDRFDALDPFDLTADDRWKIFATTVAAALRQPVFGFGFGTHPVAYHPYQPPSLPGQVHHAHNDYVNVFFEAGFVGLAFLVGALAFWFVRAWRAQQPLPGPDRLHVSAAIAAVAAVALHSFVDMDLRIPANAILFSAMIAVGSAASRGGQERPKSALLPPILGLAAAGALFLGLDAEAITEKARASDTAGMERLGLRALGLSPYEYRAAWAVGRAAQRRGDPPLADRRFETAADLWPAHPGVQLLAGLWFAQADLDRAARCFHRLLEQDPSKVPEVMAATRDERVIPPVPAAVAAYARFLVAEGDWPRAVRAFDRGVPATAEHAPLYDGFAASLNAAGQWGLEATIHDRRLQLKSDAPAHAAAARAWLKLGAHEMALKRAETASTIDLGNASWWALRAEIQRAAGRPMEARDAYTEALSLAPMELAYRHGRASAYLELRMFGPAAEDFRAALLSRPADRTLVLGYADALAGDGRPDAARILLDDYLRKLPDDAGVKQRRDALPR